MIPKIDLSKFNKDSISKKEVIEMTEALSDAFAMVLREKEREHLFAKVISYISLTIAMLVLFLEVFSR